MLFAREALNGKLKPNYLYIPVWFLPLHLLNWQIKNIKHTENRISGKYYIRVWLKLKDIKSVEISIFGN